MDGLIVVTVACPLIAFVAWWVVWNRLVMIAWKRFGNTPALYSEDEVHRTVAECSAARVEQLALLAAYLGRPLSKTEAEGALAEFEAYTAHVIDTYIRHCTCVKGDIREIWDGLVRWRKVRVDSGGDDETQRPQGELPQLQGVAAGGAGHGGEEGVLPALPEEATAGARMAEPDVSQIKKLTHKD